MGDEEVTDLLARAAQPTPEEALSPLSAAVAKES
jgi:hypothetical protein